MRFVDHHIKGTPRAACAHQAPLPGRRGQDPRFLVRDRDRSYDVDFIRRARRIKIKAVLTPVCAPWVNANAERVVGTPRLEGVASMIRLSESHLRTVLVEGSGSVQRQGRVVAWLVPEGVHRRQEREAA